MLIFDLATLCPQHEITKPHHPHNEVQEVDPHYEDPLNLYMTGKASQIVITITGGINVGIDQGDWKLIPCPKLIDAGNKALAKWFKQYQRQG